MIESGVETPDRFGSMFLHCSRTLRVMAATARPWVIFVLGGPGAGKGTQCVNIVRVSNARFLPFM